MHSTDFAAARKALYVAMAILVAIWLFDNIANHSVDYHAHRWRTLLESAGPTYAFFFMMWAATHALKRREERATGEQKVTRWSLWMFRIGLALALTMSLGLMYLHLAGR